MTSYEFLDNNGLKVVLQKIKTLLNSKADNSSLESYQLKEDAFSGDYLDLKNKPFIPTKLSDLGYDGDAEIKVTVNSIESDYINNLS